MGRKLTIAAIGLVALLATACGGAAGTSTSTAAVTTTPGEATASGTVPKTADPVLGKISSKLLMARSMLLAGDSIDDIANAEPLLSFDGNLVLIEIRFDSLTPETEAAVIGLGLTDPASFIEAGVMTGAADLLTLDAIATILEVASIGPLAAPETNS